MSAEHDSTLSNDDLGKWFFVMKKKSGKEEATGPYSSKKEAEENATPEEAKTIWQHTKKTTENMTLKLNRLQRLSETRLDEVEASNAAFIKDFLGKRGYDQESDIKSMTNMASWHHATANDIGKQIKGQVIQSGNKLSTGKAFMKDVGDLRKALAKRASAAPVEAGTRHIATVTDMSKLDKIKAHVKDHNKANKTDRLKLGIYDRPANKDIKEPHKKIWLDGSVEALKKAKKAFEAIEAELPEPTLTERMQAMLGTK